jgi:hypothetical protein
LAGKDKTVSLRNSSRAGKHLARRSFDRLLDHNRDLLRHHRRIEGNVILVAH